MPDYQIFSLGGFPPIWGHFAGFGINATDTEFIDQAIKECLAE
jgi:hypothetical protein